MSRPYDPKTAPIRFRRVEPGLYVSVCGEAHNHRAMAVEVVNRRHGHGQHAASLTVRFEQHEIEYRNQELRFGETHATAPWEPCPRGICGRYRIRKTEHSGRHVTNQGRTRWWLHDVARDCPVLFLGYGSSRHFLSLEDAIRSLNIKVGQFLREGFEVLAKLRSETAAADEARAKAEALRASRVGAVADILRLTYAHASTAGATAEQIVDALFGAAS